MNKKGFLQISFQWLFAIIVGAIILFLAIYAVSKFSSTNEATSGTKINAQLSALLNPLESSFETSKITPLNLGTETRIYPLCDSDGGFGIQSIKTSQKSFNKWSTPGIGSNVKNRYLFLENPVQGKNFYVFSKPFEFPFKITDLMYIISENDNYCFKNAPSNIKEEIIQLKPKSIFIEDCPDNSIKVCFNMGVCDINVNTNSNYVQKNNTIMYFEEDSLMYATIFSPKQYYECQLNRLISREKILIDIYIEKADIISNQKCYSSIKNELIELKNLLNNFRDSDDLSSIYSKIISINNKNKNSKCRLW